MSSDDHSNTSSSQEPLIIGHAESFLLRVPVRPIQVDSQSSLDAWNVLAVKLVTDSGIEGWGYQTGFGTAMSVLQVFIDKVLLPDITGLDARLHTKWWSEHYLLRHHTGLNGPAFQGVSAPEVAAWDLRAKSAHVPLWNLLGGVGGRRIPVYDTNAGWLGYSVTELVDNVKRSVDKGFHGVKIKIGSPDFGNDVHRLEAVRKAVGDEFLVAVDVNNRWNIDTALKCAPTLEDFDIAWLEEPLYPFDVRGHAELGAAITTPLLHGENIYDPLMFRDMIDSGAMDIVQPSDMKLGGLTRWLEVSEMAASAGRKIIPAGWTMMQIDQHLAAVTPHCSMVEHIPWITEIFQDPVSIDDGTIVVSDTPGASTEIKNEALEKFAI